MTGGQGRLARPLGLWSCSVGVPSPAWSGAELCCVFFVSVIPASFVSGLWVGSGGPLILWVLWVHACSSPDDSEIWKVCHID